MKIVCLDIPNFEKRSQLWLEFWKQSFASKQIEFVAAPFSEHVEVLKTADVVMVDRELSWQLRPKLGFASKIVSNLEQFECLEKAHGQWNPLALSQKVLTHLIVHQKKKLSNRARAYLCGTDADVKLFASAAVDLGFSRIEVVESQGKDQTSLLQFLRRVHIGIDFQIAALKDLSKRTGDGTLFLNGFDLTQDELLLETVTYLNFIESSGLILDIHPANRATPIYDEVLQVQLGLVRAHEFFAEFDHRLLQAVTGLSLPAADLAQWEKAYTLERT